MAQTEEKPGTERRKWRFVICHAVWTPRAEKALDQDEVWQTIVERHLYGDWGDVSDELRLRNERALDFTWAWLYGRYTTADGTRFRITTELHRFRAHISLDDEDDPV
jgi:hypothetical protein